MLEKKDVIKPEQSYKSSHLYGKEWKRKKYNKKKK